MFRLTYYYTGFRLYGLRIYGLFGFISVIWSMVNHILVLIFSNIWSFWLYGQIYQDKTVDHTSETRCTYILSTVVGGVKKIPNNGGHHIWKPPT